MKLETGTEQGMIETRHAETLGAHGVVRRDNKQGRLRTKQVETAGTNQT